MYLSVMDRERKPSQELAKEHTKYEANFNPELNDTAATAQTLEQKSPSGSTTSAVPDTKNPKVAAQSVAAPPVTPADPAIPTIAATAPDESSEEDFSAAIERARQIIDRTKGDPYAQNREINELKVQFMKQQFNKDININKPDPV